MDDIKKVERLMEKAIMNRIQESIEQSIAVKQQILSDADLMLRVEKAA